ncbi:hypothetical protein [Clostridium sp.]|uniref:hypothetical protein n=1 Tax=Clostridium sp. TaxID=1506 RepID=UPI0025BB62D4|nr:hypothetical protein [Clostridium sp.]MCI9069384.1 hypothetical protein [Clostridium sp.]
MNIDLYLNLKSVLNIYDEYQTKFKECEEKLSEKKSQDDKHYYDYLDLISTTKDLIEDIKEALNLINGRGKDNCFELLDELKNKCEAYEKNGNKIANIYNDIYNKKILINNSYFSSNVLSEILITKSFFEEVKYKLESEYIKLAKFIIDNNIKSNQLAENKVSMFI